MAEQISYKCPNCGGALNYMPAEADYGCPYCASRFTLERLEELFGKQDGMDAAEESALNSYSCPGCGAEIVAEESTAATFCYYCHSPVILSGKLGGEHRPDYVLPFSIDRKKALGIFDSWIRKKRFVPKSFYDRRQIEKFSGVYFPYLLYRAEIRAHVDTTGRKVRRSPSGNYENITTEIYQVRRDGELPGAAIAKNALKKNNRILAEAVQPFDSSALKPFHPSYLSGFVAERKDMELREAEGGTVREVKNYALSRLRSSFSEYEDLSVGEENIELANESWSYALMPVWTMTYRDRNSDKLYYFSLNGDSGKVVGELPVDRGALFRYMLSIFVAVLLPLLALCYFLL